MRMKVDLHTHSTASDGQYTPSELTAKAAAAGIEALALTDHDTIDGVEEMCQAGREYGVKVLRGVELGAKEYKGLHILGYCYSEEAPELQKLCMDMKRGREERAHRILDYLHENGIHISLDEVEELAGGNIIARPHFAQVMVKRGYVSTAREAFSLYLDTDEYQKIERVKASAETCIQAIRQSGGKAVLAHPYQVGLSYDELEILVKRLKAFGLDGIECYYTEHTQEMTRFCLELAKRYHLFVTAGSDYHGERVKPDVLLKPIEIDMRWSAFC